MGKHRACGPVRCSPTLISDALTGWSILGCRLFSFRTHSLLANSLMEVPLYLLSLAASRILTLSFQLCLGGGLFGFILFGTLSASYTWISVSFFRFGKFSASFLSNTCLIPFSLLLLGSLLCADWLTLCLPIGLKYWFHFFNVSDVLIGRVPLFYLPDHLFVLLHHCLPVARPVRAGLSSACRSAAALLYSNPLRLPVCPGGSPATEEAAQNEGTLPPTAPPQGHMSRPSHVFLSSYPAIFPQLWLDEICQRSAGVL